MCGEGCCRKATPKEVVLMIGYLGLLGALGTFVSSIFVNSQHMSSGANVTFLISICVACVIAMIISILLIVGVKKNNPGLLSPWLVMQPIGLVGLLFAPLYLVVEPLEGPQLANFLLRIFVSFVFGTAFWIFVFKYKKRMEREVREELTRMKLEPTETV